MPSSVLSNSDSTHIGSREILLQYFDIVALVELGSGTFGKTGTNTVVLFIRRKRQLPEPAVHYRNRLEDWFDNDTEMEAYQDQHFIKKYCEHIAIPFEHYQTLLYGSPSAELLAFELFQDYKKDFDQSSDIKKLATQKFFKDFSPEQKHIELNKRFLAYLQKIEKDKLFYFVLAYTNPQQVLIVKSPSDNKEQKQFLGYEWSAAKGNEGIKLTTDAQGKHLTPLYDPEYRYNRDKINALVQENFSGNPVAIPESLQTYASLVNLVDLLDFSRKDFDKHISLSVKKTVSFECKWDLVKLGDICSFEYGKPLPEDNRTNGKYPVMGSNGRVGFHNECLIKGPSIIVRRKGSAGKVIWENVDCFPIDTTFYVTLKNNNVLLSYLFLALKQLKLDKLGGGTGVPGLNRNEAYQLKIPLPPLEIQTQIAQKCNAIDADVEAAQASLEQTKKELTPLLKNDKFSLEKLENVAVKVNEQINPNNYEGEVNYIGLENIESQTGRLIGDIRANYNQIKSVKTCFKINDILYGKLRPNLNKVYLAKEDGICSTDILVFRFENVFLAQYYAHYLLSDEFNKEVLKGVKGQQLPRTSWKHLSFIKVSYPSDLATQ